VRAVGTGAGARLVTRICRLDRVAVGGTAGVRQAVVVGPRAAHHAVVSSPCASLRCLAAGLCAGLIGISRIGLARALGGTATAGVTVPPMLARNRRCSACCSLGGGVGGERFNQRCSKARPTRCRVGPTRVDAQFCSNSTRAEGHKLLCC